MSPIHRRLITLTLLSSLMANAQNDEPNYKTEDRFHQIFEKFNAAPTSDENWNRVLDTSKAQSYTVMKTDTLWDISEVLFADPVFWPKIWSFNTTDILNPHEIKPGWKLNFVPGTLYVPPALVVTEFEGHQLPPPKPIVPIAKIPPSLPEHAPDIKRFVPPDIKRPDYSALTKIPPLPLPVEIMEDRPERRGQIVEIEEGSKLAADNRDIYVKLDDDMKKGTYTVIKNIEKNRYGYIIQYRAELKVHERINDGENIYRATMTKVVDSVEVGDYVLPGEIPVVNIEEKPAVSEAPLVRIVGGFRSPTDLLFAPFSIVFLNGGSDDGLKEGDVLKLYQDPRTRLNSSKVVKAYVDIGRIKVLRVQEDLATAYILKSKNEIREGDLAGVLMESSESGSDPDSDDSDLTLD